MLQIEIKNSIEGKWELIEYLHAFANVQKWDAQLYERAFLDVALPEINESVHNFKFYTDGLIEVKIAE